MRKIKYMLKEMLKPKFEQLGPLYVSYGKDERSGLFVDGNIEWLMIRSKDTIINVWPVAKRDRSEKIFECERHTIGLYDLYFEDFDPENDFYIFHDRINGELIIHNESKVPVATVNRILDDYGIVKQAMDKVANEFHEHGYEEGLPYLQGTYPWANFYICRGDELHMSHPGGFSIYYMNSKIWEFDSYLERGTVRMCNRILRYK